MTCPNCNHQNIDGASFCGNCGFTLITQVAGMQAQAPADAPQTSAPPMAQPTNPALVSQPTPAASTEPTIASQLSGAPEPQAPLPMQSMAMPAAPPVQPVTGYPPGQALPSQPAPSLDPAVAGAAPMVAAPVTSPAGGPLKETVKEVKWFATTAIISAAIYSLLYLVNIFFANQVAQELGGSAGSAPPSLSIVILGVIGLVGSVLTFVAGTMANKAATGDKVRKATVLGIVGGVIIGLLAGSVYGAGAIATIVLAVLARKALKKQGL